MIELKGKYTDAKIFVNTTEEKTIEQVQKLIDMPEFKGGKVRIMPDCCPGNDMSVVGFTMPVGEKLYPSLVSVDIGCGMSYIKLPKYVNCKQLDEIIKSHIPSGSYIHARRPKENFLSTKAVGILASITASLDLTQALCSLGTLGGGNHFIEVAHSTNSGDQYLIVHTGSRKIGVNVCSYWQAVARDDIRDSIGKRVSRAVQALKNEGLDVELQPLVPGISKAIHGKYTVPDKNEAWLTGEHLEEYIKDVKRTTLYASLNREYIITTIFTVLGWGIPPLGSIKQTVHNYIGKDRIIRKGAIASYEDKQMLIPLNMRDGSLLCTGKSNKDWNCSAPHGAGRVLSRTDAKEQITLEDYKKSMVGIWASTVGYGTIDEAPAAYKDSKMIESLLSDTATVVDRLIPIYNFKAEYDECFNMPNYVQIDSFTHN